jgi:hypothetical protein
MRFVSIAGGKLPPEEGRRGSFEHVGIANCIIDLTN